jgi:ABC-type glycerol-3-phosphate transport system substrate-binding protein
MMFYRSDILAELGTDIPDTWTELMGLLPDMQANNMSIGLSYGSAIDFILYQRGGNMWLHTDNDAYAGARIGLNTDVAKASFSWVTRLYTEFGFDVSFDASNRFRTGEMPIVISEYTGTYNTLTVYATELNGVWGFCSLPGWERPHPKDEGMIWIDYSSLCSISATVLLHGYEDALSSWQFMQWQTHEDIQSEYGNQMVALIGPSAKYESANIYALDGMSWTAEEKKAIWDQMDNLYSIVNYPGSYIISRYTQFAFLAAVNDRQDPVEALMGYIDAINDEIYRKRAEFDMPLLETDALPQNA